MTETAKEGKLPKNIRQIGQMSGNQKVYIEDYVITYLKQLPQPDENVRAVILYGTREVQNNTVCWFVNGAVEAQKDFFMEKTVIDQDSWQKVNELAGRFFPELTVLGWALIGNESVKAMEEQVLRTQKLFFRPEQKLYFEYVLEEKVETLYFYEKGKMKQQTGYCIYYDRNECMQNYMVSLRAAERHPEEFEADRAAQQFRSAFAEKKTEMHKKHTTALMTCVSLVLVMVIMVIGITLLNNYEKMQDMEQVLHQIAGKISNTEDTDSQETAASDHDTAEDALQVQTKAVNAEQGLVTQNTDEAAAAGASGDALLEQLQNENTAGTQTDADAGDEGAQDTAAQISGTNTADTAAASQLQDSAQNTASQTDEGAEATENTSTQTDADASTEDSAQGMATQTSGANTTAQNNADAAETSYIIQKGDTLAKICLRYYGNLSNIDKICEMNQIENKDNIQYGQKIILP
jgi:nucleoid-associated protein YgaU